MLRLLISAAARLPFHPFLAVLAALALASSVAEAAPDKAALLKGAQTEGVVIVHGPPGRQYEKLLSKGFEESHPSIQVEYSDANNPPPSPSCSASGRPIFSCGTCGWADRRPSCRN